MIRELIKRPWEVLAHVGWLAIIILSLVPSASRPHTGASGASEHFVAYAMVAFCYAMAFGTGRGIGRSLRNILMGMVALSVCLELAQMFIPGRTSEVIGVISAALGVSAGAGGRYVLLRLAK